MFVDALYEGFMETREPTDFDMATAITLAVPLARLMDCQIAALRQWAKGRAREAADIRNTQNRNSRRVTTGGAN